LAASVGRPSATVAVVAALLGLAAVCAVGVVAGNPAILAAAPAAALAWIAIGGLAKRKLGGINGDSLGAAEQTAEIATLAALAAVLGGGAA
jgi:adenosylcobinamide-GDP ribazoletransferase